MEMNGVRARARFDRAVALAFANALFPNHWAQIERRQLDKAKPSLCESSPRVSSGSLKISLDIAGLASLPNDCSFLIAPSTSGETLRLDAGCHLAEPI